MDYSILVAEIDGDPLGRGYAEMTDAQVVASLAVEDRTLADATLYTAREILRRYGLAETVAIMSALDAAAGANRAIQLVVVMLEDFGGDGGLDFADAQTVAGIDALVATEVLTGDQGDELKALGQRTVIRATELGIDVPTVHQVTRARQMIGG